MKQENDNIQTTKIMLMNIVITRYHINTNLYYWYKEVEKLSCNSKNMARIWLWNKLSCASSKSSYSGRRKSTSIHKIILNIYSQFSRRISAITSESWTSLIQNKENYEWKDDCEHKLPKMKKQKKGNWVSEQTVENIKKRSQSKQIQDLKGRI